MSAPLQELKRRSPSSVLDRREEHGQKLAVAQRILAETAHVFLANLLGSARAHLLSANRAPNSPNGVMLAGSR